MRGRRSRWRSCDSSCSPFSEMPATPRRPHDVRVIWLLRRLDCCVERRLTVLVVAIGDQHDRAPPLTCGQRAGRFGEGIENGGAARRTDRA